MCAVTSRLSGAAILHDFAAPRSCESPPAIARALRVPDTRTLPRHLATILPAKRSPASAPSRRSHPEIFRPASRKKTLHGSERKVVFTEPPFPPLAQDLSDGDRRRHTFHCPNWSAT